MARELLEEMLSSPEDQKSKIKVRPATMERGVHHDLESFILVLFYAAIKRGLESRAWDQRPEINSIRDLYRSVFGGHTIEDITTGRMRLVNPRPDCLLNALDKSMYQLLLGCRNLLQRQYGDRDSNNPLADEINQVVSSQKRSIITYGELYQIYNIAIRRLSRPH